MKMSAEQIERIKGLGYTESEAHFLYIVAIHSGYFTLRQFCTFTRAARGKRSFLFARKLLQSEHASMRDYPGVGPAEIPWGIGWTACITPGVVVSSVSRSCGWISYGCGRSEPFSSTRAW
jgi:hypothetical protein